MKINGTEISPIYSNGKVGQIVVLDRVHFSDDFMRKFEQPYLFKIISKEGEGYNTAYQLESLATGELINLPKGYDSYLVDASEWASAMNKEMNRQDEKYKSRIEGLKQDLDLLKSILIAQGNKTIVVTEEQEKRVMEILSLKK